MMQRLRGMKEHEGFTLIELLIVIVILGILAAIVVFAVGGITDRGVNSACKSDFKNVEVAQEAHKAKTNPSVYADDVDALVAANLLREAPSTANYTITTDNTGVVKVNGTEGTSLCPA
jgi:general secretion pathway protein G